MMRYLGLLRGALTIAACIALMGIDCGGGDCPYAGKVYPNGANFQSEDGCNSCSCRDGSVACTARACAGQWWKTCGDPVCGPMGHRADPNIAPCTTEKVGDACTALDKKCDPIDPCNVRLVCATSDPTKQPGGCPISRARYKSDIQYLDEDGLERYRRSLLDLKLATYRYKGTPPESPLQLGFIIDDIAGDAGARPEVNADGESVNLYGYSSMAVATLQLQAREIAELKAQLEELKKQVAARPRRR